MRQKSTIEIHTKRLNPVIGLAVRPAVIPEKSAIAHRDDHYVFFAQLKGETRIMIDFQETVVKDRALCFVAPGQVHLFRTLVPTTGWFLFVDPDLVGNISRDVFESQQNLLQVTVPAENAECYSGISLLERLFGQPQHALQAAILRDLAQSVVGMIATRFLQPRSDLPVETHRKTDLAAHFRKLVRQHFISHKQVSYYAQLLHLSPLYLNEVIKGVTGFTASYWIQQEILLEARRLLCYTVLDARQVALQLGYTDHAYFSRFFKKNTGTTPLVFRKQNHALSNH